MSEQDQNRRQSEEQTAPPPRSSALLSTKAPGQDVESDDKPLRYPRSIGFIISNEFCERFSYYGMRTILVLYLRDKLGYTADDATVIYHVFTMFVYFFPVFGAMLADSLLGKFRTIFYVSIIYALGNILLSLTAMPPLGLPSRELTILGLFLVALGTGGIKPCVSAFGGDQFRIPQQAKQLATFFSLFYFAINAGSLISTFLTPILRMDVHCFEEDDCYSLAFGVPGVLMVLSIFIFVGGKWLYVIKEPSGNMVVQVSKCIGNAITMRSKLKKTNPREHWLDYAEEAHGTQMVADIKALLRVLVLYLPLPVFWALFDQQGSRWTFQATRMNGKLGSFILKPDQMQVVNPLLILAFIPLFEAVIYPLLAKCKISRPLQKLTIGGILAGVAFLISGIVELELEKTYPVLPSEGIAQLRIFNGYNCDLQVHFEGSKNATKLLKALQVYEDKSIPVQGTITKNIHFTFANGPQCPPADQHNKQHSLKITEKTANSYYFSRSSEDLFYYEDNVDKSNTGYPAIRVLTNSLSTDVVQITVVDKSDNKTKLETNSSSTAMATVLPGKYDVLIKETKLLADKEFELGGVYTLMITETAVGTYEHKLLTIVEPNSMHMLWLIPQYVVITLGEVMFSVTGLEFSFSQAPVSMKSVLQACWLLTVAFGNVIVVIVAEAKGFDKQSSEFFLFAALMIVDMGLFVLLAMRYKYVIPAPTEDEDEVGEGGRNGDLPLSNTDRKGEENRAYE